MGFGSRSWVIFALLCVIVCILSSTQTLAQTNHSCHPDVRGRLGSRLENSLHAHDPHHRHRNENKLFSLFANLLSLFFVAVDIHWEWVENNWMGCWLTPTSQTLSPSRATLDHRSSAGCALSRCYRKQIKAMKIKWRFPIRPRPRWDNTLLFSQFSHFHAIEDWRLGVELKFIQFLSDFIHPPCRALWGVSYRCEIYENLGRVLFPYNIPQKCGEALYV